VVVHEENARRGLVCVSCFAQLGLPGRVTGADQCNRAASAA
jgi:hypothetical protein